MTSATVMKAAEEEVEENLGDASVAEAAMELALVVEIPS